MASSALLGGIADGRDPDRGHRHARAVAVFARDPELQSVRLPRRCPARGAPRPRRPDAPDACPPTMPRGPARSIRRRSRRSRPRRGPAVRDADELHEALLSFALMPVSEAVASAVPRARRRPTRDYLDDRRPLVLGSGRAAGAGPLRLSRTPRSIRPLPRPALANSPTRPSAAPPRSLRGWFECSGPRTSEDYADRLAMPRDVVDQALARTRGRRPDPARQVHGRRGRCQEWCHRRLLARIHRLTIGRLRREIEPVTTAEYYAFLNRWQHLAPGTQLHGRGRHAAGDPAASGLGVSAAAWETVVLPRRIAKYDPDSSTSSASRVK